MDVEAVIDELYALHPSDFVAARNGYVTQARSSGDSAAATVLAGLKRPTTAGWAVNLLAREHPEEIDTVLSLGEGLQRAQRRLDAKTLRELGAQRQRVVRSLAVRARELIGERGRTVNETVLREVAQTLHAAMADPDLAQDVRRGRVLAAASYSGFGPPGLAAVTTVEAETGDAAGEGAGSGRGTVVGTGSKQSGSKARRKPARDAAVERARAELRTVRDQARRARSSLADAEGVLAGIRAEAADVAETVRDLQSALAEREARAQFLTGALSAAVESVTSARDEVERAEQRIADAESELHDRMNT